MNKYKNKLIVFLSVIIIIPALLSLTSIKYSETKSDTPQRIDPPYQKLQSRWAEETFSKMTLEQKVAQLFMVPVYPNSQTNITYTKALLDKYDIGGIIYFKGHPTQTARLTNDFQNIARTPLMVAIDGEWGVSMRLDSIIKFPYQMTLGAIEDNSLIYDMAKEIARQCNILGINVNFAPVVDINNNRDNPVIGIRSFGQNPRNVVQKGYAYMAGLQDENILAVAKHFPGHGDTDKDSHKTLPVINHNYDRLKSVELYPFQNLIQYGVGAVMVAHLYIPRLEDTPNLPATLSPRIVNGLLRDTLGFKGLVFTDAMDMKGVSDYFSPGEAAIRALMAGNDIILMPKDFLAAYNAVLSAVKRGEIPESLIDKKVKKILKAKAWMGLSSWQPVNTDSIVQRINTPDALVLKRKLYENAITLVKNQDNLVPLKHLENKTIATVVIGDGEENRFSRTLNLYDKTDIYTISKKAKYEDFASLRERVKNYDIVIVSIHKTNPFAVKTYGISENSLWFVARLAEETNVILDLFASPYALERFRNLSKVKSIIVSYQDDEEAQDISAQIIYGGIGAKGKLPVATAGFKLGQGITTDRIRLKYAPAQEININAKKLEEIDSLIGAAIEQGVIPGCQVLAIKDTVVFLNKTYGYYTYRKEHPVDTFTLYDVASVTKVASTTLALMKLHDEGKFDINKKLSYYLPELDTTDKANLRIIDVLTHQARLKSWIPFYLHTIDPKTHKPDPKIYSHKRTELYSVKVADNLYMNHNYIDTIYRDIYNSPLRRYKRYLYSDLGFYLFKKIVEQQTGMSIDKYVENNFYKPLGASYTVFNPLQYFPKEMIAPTENDKIFRHQLVQGYVQDYGAAMLGGIGGHAGLFSNANDLGKIFQMLLQKGYYADRQYISPETIRLFTTKPFRNNRRALGFDSTWGRGKSIASSLASIRSFGHTGFTGCMVWADPEYDFIFVFLSNRVYPDIKNNKINHTALRTKIHTLLYESLPEFNTPPAQSDNLTSR